MKSNAKKEIIKKYPELKSLINELIEDIKFSIPFMVPKNECKCKHQMMDGVMYRRCKKCRGIYVVRDEEYVKKHGELCADYEPTSEEDSFDF